MNHPGNDSKYAMALSAPLEHSPYAGKHLIFLGSSVTLGEAACKEGIPEYFASRFGCRVTKEAVSGTTLTDLDRESYVQRMLHRLNTEEPCDLFVCQLSTNDAARGLPLGAVASGRDRSSFNTGTILGAMEFIISYAKDVWHCPVAFYTGSFFQSAPYEAMVESLPALQEKWGIHVLDLWHDSAFNDLSEEARALYMRDPVHPTKAGYRQWWCPELERQILEKL